MTRKDDDQAARLERARAIGLFRYMLIREAADPTLTGRQRGAMVRAIAAVPHTRPGGADGPDHPVDAGPVDPGLAQGRVRRAGPVAATVPAADPVGGLRAGDRAEEGEPGPERSAGQADPGGPARVGAGRADPAADVRPHRADRAAGPGRAGGLRPVRSGPPERNLDRGRTPRAEDRRAQNIPFRLRRRPLPGGHGTPVGVRRGHRPAGRRAAPGAGRPRRPLLRLRR